MSRFAMLRTSLAVMILLAGCATAPPVEEPQPLQGEAAALIRRRIATFDGPDGPDALYAKPGSVQTAEGLRVDYDRFLLVGSELGSDRGASFAAFLDSIRQAGGDWRTVTKRASGEPSRVLVVVDGKRVLAAVQQW